jgi:hypothetical protein
VEARADGGFPGSRFFGPLRSLLDRAAVGSFPGAFGVQFVLTAKRQNRRTSSPGPSRSESHGVGNSILPLGTS